MGPFLKIFLTWLVKVSLTLARQIKDSLYTVLAIKDVHGVFALVLLGGLIDLKPKLLSCDSRLNSLWGGNLSIPNEERAAQTSINAGLFTESIRDLKARL